LAIMAIGCVPLEHWRGIKSRGRRKESDIPVLTTGTVQP